ncbi:MAG TPA: SRPBCC family protein [Gemmatimonadaceae bacterium]|nr:SRPBCC family protein [Gemmatimonadaceae bacterium]
MNPTKAPGTLDVSTPSDLEIRITRVFDAPRQMVFDAYTKPELLRRWMGRHNGSEFPVCEVDLRTGGSYRYVWRHPKGWEMGMGGTFLEVTPPRRLVTTERFDQPWYDGSCVGTVEFDEKDGRTTLTMTLRYDTKAARDSVLKSPMATGMEQGFEMLAELLDTLQK